MYGRCSGNTSPTIGIWSALVGTVRMTTVQTASMSTWTGLVGSNLSRACANTAARRHISQDQDTSNALLRELSSLRSLTLTLYSAHRRHLKKTRQMYPS